MTRSVVLGVSVALALAFWATIPLRPLPGTAVVKWTPIALLALSASRSARRARWWFVAGLLAHGVGDVLLDLDRVRLFRASIGPFLAGHALYLVGFVRAGARQKLNWTRTTKKCSSDSSAVPARTSFSKRVYS